MEPNFAEIYAKAVETTASCKEARDALLDSPEQFLQKIVDARAALLKTIMDGVEEKIMHAAERGVSTVDLYTFHGNDFIQDISILFLLKGPKPMTPKLPDGTPDPLLPEIQSLMAPFTVVHDWDGISGGNRLVARWSVN